MLLNHFKIAVSCFTFMGYKGQAQKYVMARHDSILPVRVRCSVSKFWVSPCYHDDNADYKTQEHHNVINGDPVKSQHN